MRYCTTCGAPSAGSAYCTTCGAAIEASPSTTPLATGPAPAARRSPVLPAVVGVLAVALAAGGVTWFLAQDEAEPCTLAAAVATPCPSGQEGSAGRPGAGAPSPAADGGTSTAPTTAEGDADARVGVVPPPAPAESDPVPEPPAAAVPPPPTSPAAPVLAGATGTPFWTVIVASKDEPEGGQAAAGAFAASLAAQGYEPELFHSSDHASLRPGYWVASTGRYGSAAEASSLSRELKAVGFAVAYPRCVGTAAECA